MRISIIGAGRVGRALGRLLHQADNVIVDVVCRSHRSAAAAARFIGAGNPQARDRARLSATDLILISTPDDNISNAVGLIADQRSRTGASVVLHTSGALDRTVLSALSDSGMSIGSCHPLQTFASASNAFALVRSTYFCLEGDQQAVRAARRLVRDVGARYFEIEAGEKATYHAAAVLASGGVVSLLSIACDLMVRSGLSEIKARRVLEPLVAGTIANIRATGHARALTGPVRRGDAGTVERNTMALAAIDQRWERLYRLLGQRALELAEQAGADRRQLAAVRRLLDYDPSSG